MEKLIVTYIKDIDQSIFTGEWHGRGDGKKSHFSDNDGSGDSSGDGYGGDCSSIKDYGFGSGGDFGSGSGFGDAIGSGSGCSFDSSYASDYANDDDFNSCSCGHNFWFPPKK